MYVGVVAVFLLVTISLNNNRGDESWSMLFPHKRAPSDIKADVPKLVIASYEEAGMIPLPEPRFGKLTNLVYATIDITNTGAPAALFMWQMRLRDRNKQERAVDITVVSGNTEYIFNIDPSATLNVLLRKCIDRYNYPIAKGDHAAGYITGLVHGLKSKEALAFEGDLTVTARDSFGDTHSVYIPIRCSNVRQLTLEPCHLP
jgi:hypothetical protein